jgi:hypothetical protein
MKRFMVVVLAALCVAALLPQTLSAGFGIKGGYTLSKFSLTTDEPLPFSFVNLPYYTGGIYFSLKLGPLAIQPEVLYTRMGARYAVEGDSLEYRFDYIQVPLLLKLSVIPAGPIRPVIFAGGYGSYMLKANGVETVDGESESTDLGDMFEKYDYGVIGGAGLEFKLPGISFSIEGRYNYGLKNILADPIAGEAVKNRSIMALVGIGF